MDKWTTTAVGPASTQPEPERFNRFNPGSMYVSPTTERPLNWREDTLLKVLKVAISNGWTGWKTHVNDAVTLGQEAEGVLRDYRKGAKPIEPLLFDHQFAAALVGEHMKDVYLATLARSENRMQWLKDNIL